MGVVERESVERKRRKPIEKCYRHYVLSPKYSCVFPKSKDNFFHEFNDQNQETILI